MDSDSSTPSNSRRSFVKKSLAASLIAAQPTLLAGLLRAQGGGGQTTSDPWESTMPGDSTLPNTTGFWETTTPESTNNESTEEELVLVCVGEGPPVQHVVDSSAATSVTGGHRINRYRVGDLMVAFSGPKKGDFTSGEFTVLAGGTFFCYGTSGSGSVDVNASQTVSRDGWSVVYTDYLDLNTGHGNIGGLQLTLTVGLMEARTWDMVVGSYPGQQEVVNFPNVGWMTAEVEPLEILLSDFGWYFTVMTRKDAEAYKAALQQ